MRTNWLIAVAVGLAGTTALAADVVIGYQPPPGYQPPTGAPAAPAVATSPCAEGKCAQGCGRACDGRSCWERIKAWLCYQPVKGCCDKTACGCRPAPLYAYFIDDCAQGPGCAQAPACCDKPGLWRRLCDSGHKMFASPAGHGCGAGVGCPSGMCGVR